MVFGSPFPKTIWSSPYERLDGPIELLHDSRHLRLSGCSQHSRCTTPLARPLHGTIALPVDPRTQSCIYNKGETLQSKPPEAFKNELPQRLPNGQAEVGMLQPPVRVNVCDKATALDPMSRLELFDLYRFDGTCYFRPFGTVHEGSRSALKHMSRTRVRSAPHRTLSTNGSPAQHTSRTSHPQRISGRNSRERQRPRRYS